MEMRYKTTIEGFKKFSGSVDTTGFAIVPRDLSVAGLLCSLGFLSLHPGLTTLRLSLLSEAQSASSDMRGGGENPCMARFFLRKRRP